MRLKHEATTSIAQTQEQSAETPFFVYLALSGPHSPHLVPEFATGGTEAGACGDMVCLVD